MTAGLERRYGARDLHYVTFSCYERRALLDQPWKRDVFLETLEEVRQRYVFHVFGYVVMPEHVHLMMSEPKRSDPSIALQVLKQRSAHKILKSHPFQNRERVGHPGFDPEECEEGEPERHFWTPRFYDFNVFTEKKRIEKLRYMHRNPVKRGLCKLPEQWKWSSFRHFAYGDVGVVEIESELTAARRERGAGILLI